MHNFGQIFGESRWNGCRPIVPEKGLFDIRRRL